MTMKNKQDSKPPATPPLSSSDLEGEPAEPSYQAWLDSLAAGCDCDDGPCAGCQQGSICDSRSNDKLSDQARINMSNNNTTDNQTAMAPPVRFSALLAEASHSQMNVEKVMQMAEDFCKYEAWGLDFWREPMAVLAAEVARLQSANDKLRDGATERRPSSPET